MITENKFGAGLRCRILQTVLFAHLCIWLLGVGVSATTTKDEQILADQCLQAAYIEEAISYEGVFEGMAVNTVNGDFAIAINDYSVLNIRVYNENYEYQYGYTMDYGYPFQLYFDQDDGRLVIYLRKDYRYFKIDESGSLISASDQMPDDAGLSIMLGNGESYGSVSNDGKRYIYRKAYSYNDDTGETWDVFQILNEDNRVEWEKYVVNNEREFQNSFVISSVVYCLIFGLGGGLLFLKWKESDLDADDYGPQL